MSKAVQPKVRPLGTVKYENHGRVVLVTGGCNGIGRAICDGFACSGATVVCADVADELANQLPAGVAFRHVDTSVEEQCREVVEWAVANFGGLDVLVNNAAIQPKASYTSVDQLDTADLERMTRVNFFGYTFMAKYALGYMRLQQSGVVVNLSSGQGHRTARQVPVYGPIKAANLLQAMQ